MSEEFGNNIVTVLDDEGNEHQFELLDAIETDDGRYVALLPIYTDAEAAVEGDGELVILEVVNDEMANGVFTGKNIELSWKSTNELLGVYSYNIVLVNNATKKVVASFNTADKSTFQSTDLTQLVSVVKSGNYSELYIQDLNKIFSAGDKIADGNYTVKISAVDGRGRVSSAGTVQFVQDTTPPSFDVSLVEEYLIPGGYDVAGNTIAKYLLDWTDTVKKTGSKDIVKYEIWQSVDGGTTWEKVLETTDTHYEAQLPVTVPQVYSYKIVAYDAVGNRSYDSMWNVRSLDFIPSNAKDSFNDNFNPPTLLKFDDNGRSVPDSDPNKDRELVGNGDVDCIYFETGENSEALTLTADIFDSFYGAKSKIKVEIYIDSTSNLWKTFTVSSEGRVFTDLLLDSNTTYYFKVYSTNNDSVIGYNFVWDKKALGGECNDEKDDTFTFYHCFGACTYRNEYRIGNICFTVTIADMVTG